MSIFSGVLQSLLGGVAGGANSFGDTLKEKEYFKRKVENDAATERRKSEADKIKAERDLLHALITKRADQGAYPSFGDELVIGSPKSAQTPQPSFSLNTDTPISTAGSFGDALVASAPASGSASTPSNLVTSTSDLYDLNKLGRFMSGVKFERTPEASMKDQLLFGKYGLDKSKLDETVRHNREIEGLGGERNRITASKPSVGGNGPKPLSAEAAKTLEIADGGLRNVGQLIQKTNSGSSFLLPQVFDRELNFITIDLADRIGRLRSGGAINKDEEARFNSLLPSPFDSQNEKLGKLKNIQMMFNGITSRMSPEKQLARPISAQPAAGDSPSLEDIDAEIARRMGGR